MKQLSHLLLASLFFSFAADAQVNLGIATSNWNSLEALRLNPANIADCHERFSINIVSGTVGIDNSLGTIKSVGGVYNALRHGNVNNIFSYTGNNTFSLLAPGRVQLPGAMVSINHKHSVAFTIGLRGMVQYNNFDPSLFHTLTDSNFVATANQGITSKDFNYTAHVWSEYAVSYAGVIVEDCEHLLKGGISLKYLAGTGYIGLKGRNLDARYKTGGGDDTVIVNHSDLEFATNVLSTRNAALNGFSARDILDEFFGPKDGSGIGADFGLVYDYMPDFDLHTNRENSPNRYKLRISVSVMDVGAIRYGKNVNSNALITGNGVISGQDLARNVDNFDDFRHYMTAHGFSADTTRKAATVYLPAHLRIGADYKIYKHFYANAQFLASIANRQAFGNSYYNQLTVTPRYDSRFYTVGLPVSYSFLANNIRMGVGVRVYGFFVGSDDIMGIFSNHQNGFNLYVGGFVPFYKHHRPHHTDNWDGHQLHRPDQEMQRDDDDSTGVELEVSKAGLGYAPAKSNVVKSTGEATAFTPASADDRKYLHDSMEAEKR